MNNRVPYINRNHVNIGKVNFRKLQYAFEGRVIDISASVDDTKLTNLSNVGYNATPRSGRGVSLDGITDNIIVGDISSLGSISKIRGWARSTTDTDVHFSWLNTGNNGDYAVITADGNWEYFEKTLSSSQTFTFYSLGFRGPSSTYYEGDLSHVELLDGSDNVVHHLTLCEHADLSASGLDGRIAFDSVGDNHGYYVGCSGVVGEGVESTFSNPSKISGYESFMWFDGGDDDISLGSNIALTGNFDISISAIIAKDASSVHFLSNATASASGRIAWNSGDTNVIISNDSGSVLLKAAPLLKRGELTLIRVQRTGSTVEVFLDGASIGTGTLSGTITLNNIGSVRGGATSVLAFSGIINYITIDTTDDGTDDHRWDGDGTTNGDWADAIGSNNGTVNGSPSIASRYSVTIPQTTNINWNKYGYFDGVDESTYVSTSSNFFTSASNTTISCSFMSCDFVADRMLFGNNSTLDDAIGIINAGTGLLFRIDGTTHTLAFDSTLVAYQKYDVEVTYSGTTVTCKVDGTTQTDTSTGVTGTITCNLIGSRQQQPTFDTQTWCGLIWNIAIDGQVTYYGDGEKNADWRDTVSSNHGTVNGPLSDCLSIRSFSNDLVDVMGENIREPRANIHSINLAGSGGYVIYADTPTLDLGSQATWEIWGHFYGLDSGYAMFSRDQEVTSNRGWGMFKSASEADRFDFIIVNSSNNQVVSYKSNDLTDAVNQIVITHNAGTIAGYINGQSITLTKFFGTTPTTSIPDRSYPLNIGASYDPQVNFCDDAISTFIIYDRALSATEVLNNYNSLKSKNGV